MGKVQQYKRGIGAFISSEKGQRFFNFAYSIGAAIVIWGALFKILHLPGGNMLLSLGMGTEVLMFLLTAFDRPPKEYDWSEVFPQFKDKNQDGSESTDNIEMPTVAFGQSRNAGRGAVVSSQQTTVAPANDINSAAGQYVDQINAMAQELQHLRETTAALNQVSETLLQSYRAITENSEAITASSEGYVRQMTELHRNIGGLNTIYELQLRSVSSQIDSIDRVNRGIKDIRDMYEKSATQSARYCEETERMARYMQQLNSVYEKMITAMTINMYRPVMTPPNVDGVPVNPGEHVNSALHNGSNGSHAEEPIANQTIN